MKLLIVLLLLAGCGRGQANVPTPPPLDPNCQYMTIHGDDDAHPPSCDAIKAAWARAQEHYATVDPAARSISWLVASTFRPAAIKYEAGFAPRMKIADGVYIQAEFNKPASIFYAHEGAVYCEALHMIAYMLGDPGWEMTGHEGPQDKLNFPCWSVVEAEYKAVHP